MMVVHQLRGSTVSSVEDDVGGVDSGCGWLARVLHDVGERVDGFLGVGLSEFADFLDHLGSPAWIASFARLKARAVRLCLVSLFLPVLRHRYHHPPVGA